MNERDEQRRRAFLAIIARIYGHFPRAALREWARAEFDSIVRGERKGTSDLACTAWFRSAPDPPKVESWDWRSPVLASLKPRCRHCRTAFEPEAAAQLFCPYCESVLNDGGEDV